MATLETNAKILNLNEAQKSMSRDVSSQDLSWLREQVPHVHVFHAKEEAPITAKNAEEDCNDFMRGYPYLIPTMPQWQFEYYPRYETKRTHAILVSNWSSLSLGDHEGSGSNGTRQQDYFGLVMQMVNFCKQQGWMAVHIVEGTEFMKWAVWAYCDYIDMKVTGYDPSDFDKMRQTNVTSAMEASSKALSMPLSPNLARASVSSGDEEVAKVDTSDEDSTS